MPRSLLSRKQLNPGQPTKYKPEYCKEVVEYIGGGHTTKSFARKLGVSKTTLLAWRGKRPDFDLAFEIAEGKRAELIEEIALRHAMNGNGMLTERLLLNWTDIEKVGTQL